MEKLQSAKAVEAAVGQWLDGKAMALASLDNYFDNFEAASEMGESPPTAKIPEGHWELTYAIMQWCDVANCNIDATPFVDYLVALKELSRPNWFKYEPNSYDAVTKASKRTAHVAYRILNVVQDGKSLRVAPNEGRNPDRDKHIVELRRAGKTLKEIMADLPRQNPEWELLESEQGVKAVLIRRGYSD